MLTATIVPYTKPAGGIEDSILLEGSLPSGRVAKWQYPVSVCGFTGTSQEIADQLLVDAYATDKKMVLIQAYEAAKNADYTHTDGIIFKGGRDNVNKLDERKRLSELAGLTTVDLTDASWAKHTYTIAEATAIIVAMGTAIANLYDAYNAKLTSVDAAVASTGTYSEKITAINAVL